MECNIELWNKIIDFFGNQCFYSEKKETQKHSEKAERIKEWESIRLNSRGDHESMDCKGISWICFLGVFRSNDDQLAMTISRY